MRSCGDCESYQLTRENHGECRYNPPTTFMLAMPSGPPILGPMGSAKAVGVKMSFPAAWPLVQANLWCRKFKAASEDEKLNRAVGAAGSDAN